MDILEKLSNILDYEFKKKRKRMIDFETSYKRIYVHLNDVKDDIDIDEFIYQLNRDLAYTVMRKIDETHYEVKEHIKKRKLNIEEETKECSHPRGICKCKLPLEVVPIVEAN